MKGLFQKIYAISAFVVITSCGSADNAIKDVANHKLLEEVVSSKSFEINADWALPQMTNALNSLGNAGLFPPGSAGNRINLVGITNYLRVMGDSVSGNLPFYGERQLGAGYGTNNTASIKFDGPPKDFKITRSKQNKGYEVNFSTNNGTENYTINLFLFQNRQAVITVNSSQRFAMRYSGKFKEISNEGLN